MCLHWIQVTISQCCNKDLSFKAKDYRTYSRIALDYGVRENIKLRKSNLTVAQVHAINTIKQCQRLKAINCLHVIDCVALRCPGELTKDLTLKSQGQGQQHCYYDSHYSDNRYSDKVIAYYNFSTTQTDM